MGPPETPFVRDLVLVGGGHANVEVLRSFGMHPEPGVRITTIAREAHSPYTGMLPGHIAGHYDWEEIHIDLVRLTRFANSRFLAESVQGIDPARKLIEISGRPDVRYDLCLVNTGGLPGLHLRGDGSAVPVKPIGGFLPRWREILNRTDSKRLRLMIVGAGAGGVELALAISEQHGDRFDLHLVTGSDLILEGHSKLVRRMMSRELRRAGIELTTRFCVAECNRGEVSDNLGRRLAADVVLWTGGVEAPDWPEKSGLEVNSEGFIRVDRCLRSVSHPDVLAGGDIACLVGQERPKSGVYAVRAGPFLARNARSLLRGEPPAAFKAQSRALAILGVPNGHAVASRGWMAARGKVIWRWKEQIDRRFMDRFNDLAMAQPQVPRLPAPLQVDLPQAARCGGCGSKLDSNTLVRVLRRLSECHPRAVDPQIGDDCAVLKWSHASLIATCDGFRTMTSDPWLFGRIAAHHSLGDIYAMGGEAQFALAMVSVPVMGPELVEDELFQVMSGAVSVFEECGVRLVGGHSSEGVELSVGFTVGGTTRCSPLRKSGFSSGETLVLTKPIGTGVLLAGSMEGKIPAHQVMQALKTMDASSRTAVPILKQHGATACTDVTGYGLLGHASEMARASGCGLAVDASQVPLLDGVADAFSAGIESSLQQRNEQALADFRIVGSLAEHVRKALVDPQTSGGLLASVPSTSAAECVGGLKEVGFNRASVVGEVCNGPLIIR